MSEKANIGEVMRALSKVDGAIEAVFGGALEKVDECSICTTGDFLEFRKEELLGGTYWRRICRNCLMQHCFIPGKADE